VGNRRISFILRGFYIRAGDFLRGEGYERDGMM
jgi:hypothetical protein